MHICAVHTSHLTEISVELNTVILGLLTTGRAVDGREGRRNGMKRVCRRVEGGRRGRKRETHRVQHKG